MPALEINVLENAVNSTLSINLRVRWGRLIHTELAALNLSRIGKFHI